MIFYCGLVVHITDTRAQKVVSYTSAHIAETVFAHDNGQTQIRDRMLGLTCLTTFDFNNGIVGPDAVTVY